MRRSLWMLAIALGLIAAWSIGRLQAQGDKVTFDDPNHASLHCIRVAAERVFPPRRFGETQTPARLVRTRNSSPDGMLAGTPTPPMYGS